jgi:hypothetical protein
MESITLKTLLVGVHECFFYEKVVKVMADAAALLIFLVLCGFRHISAENFALGSLRSDDRQLGRPTAPPLFSAYSVRPMLALFVLYSTRRQNLCPSVACLVHLQTAVVFPQAVERPHCDRGPPCRLVWILSHCTWDKIPRHSPEGNLSSLS